MPIIAAVGAAAAGLSAGATAAIVGATAIGGSLISAGQKKSAANQAAAIQTAKDQAAIDETRRQYDTTRADLAPWVTSGQSASGMQGNLLGLNGTDQQQAAITALQNSPLYQSLFNNGQNTLLANASATGGLRGGNTQGALANFGRDTLSGVIQNQLTNLGGVSEQGQNAAAQTGVFGANASSNIANLLQAQGQAQAGAALSNGAVGAATTKDIFGTLGGLINNKDVTSWVGKLF